MIWETYISMLISMCYYKYVRNKIRICGLLTLLEICGARHLEFWKQKLSETNWRKRKLSECRNCGLPTLFSNSTVYTWISSLSGRYYRRPPISINLWFAQQVQRSLWMVTNYITKRRQFTLRPSADPVIVPFSFIEERISRETERSDRALQKSVSLISRSLFKSLTARQTPRWERNVHD